MTNDKITKAWDKLINLGTSEETINIVTKINGYSIESLESILYAVYGYRSFDQVTIEGI